MLTSHNNKIYIYEKNNFIMFHSKYVICYSLIYFMCFVFIWI